MSATTTPREETAPLSRRDRVRVELLEIAERLFAIHGFESVSLRQIATEAGYANPATIQYHFGSKEALIEAIVAYRLPEIDRRRLALLDSISPGDLRGLVEATTRPFLDLGPSSNYARFVGQMVVSLDDHSGARELAVNSPGSRRFRLEIDRILADVPAPVRALRLNFATVLMAHSIANRRTRAAAGRNVRPSEEVFANELITAMCAVLRPEAAGS